MTDDPGLRWLGSLDWPPSLVFTRGVSEEHVFRAFGADPAEAVPRGPVDTASAGSGPMIRVGRSGDWIFAVQEDAERTQGIRPEVLRRLSAGGGEAVALYEDIGKLNHEFAHAADGVVITALTTSVPPRWRGSQPDRLEPVARELGLTEGSRPPDDLTYWEAVLAMAESVFGLTLASSDLDQPLPCARVLPVLEDLPMRPAADQVFRTGDPVIDLLMEHAAPQALARVVMTRLGRLIAAVGPDPFAEIVAAIQGLPVGEARPPENDEPAGLALRRLIGDQAQASHYRRAIRNGHQPPFPASELPGRVRRGEVARLLRLVLDGRMPDQLLASELQIQRGWDASGWQEPLSWRRQAIADFSDAGVSVPPDELQAAEEAWLAVPEPVRGRKGMIDAEPVRAHVRDLIDAGMEPARISELAGGSPIFIDRLLAGTVPQLDVSRAKRLLEIPLPE